MTIISKTVLLDFQGVKFMVTGPPALLDELSAACKAQDFQLVDQILKRAEGRIIVSSDPMRFPISYDDPKNIH